MRSRQDNIPTHRLKGQMALDSQGRVLRKPHFLTREEYDAALVQQRDYYTKLIQVEPRYAPSQFRARSTDKTWGPQNYALTESQYDSVAGMVAMLIPLPGFFCSQSEVTGKVTIGYVGTTFIRSVTIDRNGRIKL